MDFSAAKFRNADLRYVQIQYGWMDGQMDGLMDGWMKGARRILCLTRECSEISWVRWKINIQHITSAILSSTDQRLLKLMDI